MIRTMAELLKLEKQGKPMRLAVVCAQDSYVLTAVVKAAQIGLVRPILTGNAAVIRTILKEIGADPDAMPVCDAPDKQEACMLAARLVRDGEADMIMKGIVDTSVFMRAVLNRENGLRGDGILSHDLVLEIPGYTRLFHVTDSAINIAPSLKEKADIIRNAVAVAHALGNKCPKVAALCAVEKVNEKMPCTVEAAELTEMNRRGEITGCIVEGPLALDNAVSVEAAEHKSITSEVAGKADILLAPDIEAGNLLNKSIEYFAGAKKAGVIMGAKVPVALTSRASSAEAKLYTIALACLIARQGLCGRGGKYRVPSDCAEPGFHFHQSRRI